MINTYLYRADPDELTVLAQEAQTFLSSSERARWQRFRHRQSQAMYLAGRFLLRSVLARKLGCRKQDVPLQISDSGKPFLAPKMWSGSFNLSHSGDYLLLGLADGVQLGVDIECCSKPRDLDGIAATIMHREEFAYFQQLAIPAKTDYFFRLWVAKESLVKMLGKGISYGLQRIRLNRQMTEYLEPARSALVWLNAPNGFMAALAYTADEKPAPELQQTILPHLSNCEALLDQSNISSAGNTEPVIQK